MQLGSYALVVKGRIIFEHIVSRRNYFVIHRNYEKSKKVRNDLVVKSKITGPDRSVQKTKEHSGEDRQGIPILFLKKYRNEIMFLEDTGEITSKLEGTSSVLSI